MKTYELVYLLNNEMRKSISLKPDKASYIASAYKNVENKIKNESIKHMHDFVCKCATLVIQRWYRRKKGLKKKKHLGSILIF